MVIKANSWTIISKEDAVKKLDKSALLHGATGVPIPTRAFFEIEDMAHPIWKFTIRNN